MNPIEIIKKDSNRLFILSQILIVGALLTRGFPILAFIALVPLFALLDTPTGFRHSYKLVIASCLTGCIVYFITRENSILAISLYATWVLLLFWVFVEIQSASQNILNKFALVVFMLGTEYAIVKLVPKEHQIFLADYISQKPEWTRWNINTGYLGSSLWVLLVNLIFYQAIFKSEKIKKWVLLMGILFMVLPILYSLNLSNQAITKMNMMLFYGSEGLENTYSRNGELISRTGAWVSVLIVIFTIVKNKTKRNHK
jgi:apolipoprotein N-acyltransferase